MNEQSHNVFAPVLPDGARVLVLNGLITKDESYTGKPGNGRARRKLLNLLKRAGFDPATVAIAPVLPCLPKHKGDLRNDEVLLAREYVRGIVQQVQPAVVVAMGTPSISVMQDGEWPIGLHRGDLTHSDIIDCLFIPTYATGYCLPKGKWDEAEVIEGDLRKAAALAQTDEMSLDLGENYVVLLTIEDALAARDYILSRPYFSFDFETEGFKTWGDDEILTLQISTAPGEGFVFPFRGAWRRHEADYYPDWQQARGTWGFTAGEGGEPVRVLYTRESWEAHIKNSKHKLVPMRPAFRAGDAVCQTPEKHDRKGATWEPGHICRGYLTDVLSGPPTTFTGPGQQHGKTVPRDYLKMVDIARDLLESSVEKVAQNGKFDVHAARYRWDIRVRKFTFDTILAHHIVHEEKPHDLETLRARYTWMSRYNLELKAYVPTRNHSFALAPNEVLWLYGAADADCEFRLREPLWEAVLKDNPEDGPWLFENIAMPLQRALTQIEEHGMLIDRERLDTLADRYREKIEDLTRRLNVMAEANDVSVLDKWTDRASLGDWFFNRSYELVVTPEKRRKCRACKATGKAILRDHRGLLIRDDEGKPVSGEQDCTICAGAGVIVTPAVTRPMRGLGVPRWLATKTKGTGADSTGTKTRKAIIAWCNETTKTHWVEDSKGRGEVRRTKTPLSPTARKRRAWVREMVEAIDKLKVAVQAKNLFLDGDDTKEKLGARALLRYIRPDGRVHPSFNQLIETGRLSATEPNTQNISRNLEDGPYADEFAGMSVRSMFVAPPGLDFSSFDYSSEEVRILAYLSRDRDLQTKLMSCATCGATFEPTQADPERPFKLKPHLVANGHVAVDIHYYVASRVYGRPESDITKGERDNCKRVTFGIAYGQGPKGLAELLGISMQEAKELMEFYFKAFPRIEGYQGRIFSLTEKGQRVPNALGRLRHTNGLLDMRRYVDQRDYRTVLNAKHRERLNFTVQSPAADFLSLDTIALVDVWGVEDGETSYAHELAKDILGFYPSVALRDLGCYCANSMHDALEFENPTEHRDELARIALTIMERVPWEVVGWYLPVDGKHGRYWEDPDAVASTPPILLDSKVA